MPVFMLRSDFEAGSYREPYQWDKRVLETEAIDVVATGAGHELAHVAVTLEKPLENRGLHA